MTKLKIKKWEGQWDLALNEMLKAGQTTIIGCLTKLFNSIFTHRLRNARTISIDVKTYIFLVYQLELTKTDILSPHL